MGDAPAHIKKPLPFVPPEGASILVPDFECDYIIDYDYHTKSLNFIATDASIFTLIHFCIAAYEMHENSVVFAETVKALAKFVACHLFVPSVPGLTA